MFEPGGNNDPAIHDTLRPFTDLGYSWKQVGRLTAMGFVYDRVIEIDGIPLVKWLKLPNSPASNMEKLVVAGEVTQDDFITFMEACMTYPETVLRENWPELFRPEGNIN